LACDQRCDRQRDGVGEARGADDLSDVVHCSVSSVDRWAVCFCLDRLENSVGLHAAVVIYQQEILIGLSEWRAQTTTPNAQRRDCDSF
jgi:hypothetical protein